MQIYTQQFYRIVEADQGKILYQQQDAEYGIFKKIYVPLTFTDEKIYSLYTEVAQDDFQLAVKEQLSVFSKLQIRRACRTLGIEDKLNALLKSNEIFAADWADAQNIDLQDEILKQALLLGNFTEQEIFAIKGAIQNGN